MRNDVRPSLTICAWSTRSRNHLRCTSAQFFSFRFILTTYAIPPVGCKFPIKTAWFKRGALREEGMNVFKLLFIRQSQNTRHAHGPRPCSPPTISSFQIESKTIRVECRRIFFNSFNLARRNWVFLRLCGSRDLRVGNGLCEWCDQRHRKSSSRDGDTFTAHWFVRGNVVVHVIPSGNQTRPLTEGQGTSS